MPKPGKYVVAVSGGVDSVTLLDILSRQPGLELVVAHFDHGIRPNSVEDRNFVERLAGTLSAYCVCGEGNLGPKASEAQAREARYNFLRKIMKDTNAGGIITAHHQDDLIETAILNMLRGTGRKGITALKSRDDIIRPLLNVPKMGIVNYAKRQGLKWREDATNLNENYLRNYVRHNIMPKLSGQARQRMLEIIQNMQTTNQKLDSLLVKYLVEEKLDRNWFNDLPHKVALEVMAAWLRSYDIRGFDKKTLERLVVVAKAGAAGKVFPVMSGYFMEVSKASLALVRPER